MRRLQMRVGPIQRMSVPVVRQQLDLVAGVLAHPAVAPLVLIDVVTQMEHEVEVFLHHMVVGGEEALFVVLAAREGKTEPTH